MRCLFSGLLVHGLAPRSMDISATNWCLSFTHGLLARPVAAQRLTWWNAYGPTSGNPSLVLAVFPFYECFISNVFPLCMFFAIFAYVLNTKKKTKNKKH
jgi:hypothetical protein